MLDTETTRHRAHLNAGLRALLIVSLSFSLWGCGDSSDTSTGGTGGSLGGGGGGGMQTGGAGGEPIIEAVGERSTPLLFTTGHGLTAARVQALKRVQKVGSGNFQ